MIYLNIFIIFCVFCRCSSVGLDYADIEDEDYRETTSKPIGVRRFGANLKDENDIEKGTNLYAIDDIITQHKQYTKSKKFKQERKNKGEQLKSKKDKENCDIKQEKNDQIKHLTIEEMVKHYIDYSESNDYVDKQGLRNGQIIAINKTRVRNNNDNITSLNSEELEELEVKNIGLSIDDFFTNSSDDTYETFSLPTGNTKGPVTMSTKTKYTELYNLSPAIDFFKVETSRNTTRESWYVPETYPCWKLPLLYGEIGKKNRSEVFTTYPLYLRNVIDDYPDMERSRNRDHNKTDSRGAKWCTIPPCHGDHTLCVFPTDTYSAGCNSHYKVSRPTTKEQVALVNTINGIRNYVAQGTPHDYPYLPPAANMRQITYNIDLEEMARRWLKQCLPGPAPCVSLQSKIVSQLECFKRIESCCWKAQMYSNCKPLPECFVDPVVGCLHAWFMSAASHLQPMHIHCGHIGSYTFHTIQLLWAHTNKIGCAYARKRSGEIRVICNFAPGAPFYLETKYYCGILELKDMRSYLPEGNITDLTYLDTLGFNLHPAPHIKDRDNNNATAKNLSYPECGRNNEWGIVALRKQYGESWIRKKLKIKHNATIGAIARLVTRYEFREETNGRCDVEVPVYEIGSPGSLCKVLGDRFNSLCYDYKVISGFRIISVLAPMVLFSLILFDLFSSVLRLYN